MADSVHATIRLDTDLDGGLPTHEYGVIVDGLTQVLEPAVYAERSLSGKLIIHRLEEGGSPKVFDGMRYTLFLTRAEKDQIALDLGKTVYFMPHVRDEASPVLHTMLFRSMSEVEPLDGPRLEWWLAVIELEEATGNTVD